MINAIRNDIETLYGGCGSETARIYAVEGQCPDELASFYEEAAAAFPAFHLSKDALSLSVCCHIGPGALALACAKIMDYDAKAQEVIENRSRQ